MSEAYKIAFLRESSLIISVWVNFNLENARSWVVFTYFAKNSSKNGRLSISVSYAQQYLRYEFNNLLIHIRNIECQHKSITLFCSYGKDGVTKPVGRQFDNIEDMYENVSHFRKEVIMQPFKIV
jgi:hypothetical protein